MDMPSISRRSFLATAAVASAASLEARALAAVGVQLYTVRRVLPAKPLETLRAIEQIGYREVECTVGPPGGHLAEPQSRLRSKAVSVHLNDQLFMHQPEKLPAALEQVKKHGFEYAVCPWIEPRDRGGAEMIRKLGQSLNSAGELCRQAGMQLCYHNHAFEYQPTPDGRLLDILLENHRPQAREPGIGRDVGARGGRRSGQHFETVRRSNSPGALEECRAGCAQLRFNENIPRTGFRDLSNGDVDIPAVIASGQAGWREALFRGAG